MSDEAFMRALGRELSVWTPFIHSFPFTVLQSAEHTIVLGLYAGSYLNHRDYLMEIEDTELLNLLNDYNAKIAELTTKEQLVVADIVSKRYLAGIDVLIHNDKMATKSAEIAYDDAMWTAKIAALASDRAAIDTMILKVASETQKTNAKISELQAYIGIEGYNLSLVDIEIAEKEIQSSKIDVEKLQVANAILMIQVDTINAALKLIDTDLQIARTKIDSANTDRSISQIGLLADDLIIEQARTRIATSEISVIRGRIDLAKARVAEINAEIIYYDATLPVQAAEDLQSKIDLMTIKHGLRINELNQRSEEKLIDINNNTAIANQEVELAGNESTSQEAIDQMSVEVMGFKAGDLRNRVEAVIQVAEVLATANITTSLTHTIQKKK